MARNESFEDHVRRESKRYGQPLPSGFEPEPLLRAKGAHAKIAKAKAAEDLRVWWLALQRALDDPSHLAHVRAWAGGMAKRANGLGFKASLDAWHARALVSGFRRIEESQDRADLMQAAIKLGALLAEVHWRHAWRADALAGRNSRSQGPSGRAGGRDGKRRGGRWSEVDPELLPPLLTLSGAKLRLAAEEIAADADVQADSVLRRVRRLKRSRRS